MLAGSTTVTTGVLVDGRAMARTAAVTLDTATITRPTGAQQPVATATYVGMNQFTGSASPTLAQVVRA